MSRPIHASLIAAAATLGVWVIVGCGGDAGRFATSPEPPPAAPSDPAASATRSPGPGARRIHGGHEWFPLVPGRTSDFRITRLGIGIRYLRATVGAPELFFGRLAFPWVYSSVPGQVPDTNLVGLRQYFAVSQSGALQFLGAQNNGFMSFTDPPLRLLLADPAPGASWEDTVRFESFFPGGVPFFQATQVHSWRSSSRTHLKLPAGSFQALRSTVSIQEIEDAAGAWSDFTAFHAHGIAARPGDLEILRGFWFARRHGVVARDYPSSPGPTNANTNTYELIDEGVGPLPPVIPQTP